MKYLNAHITYLLLLSAPGIYLVILTLFDLNILYGIFIFPIVIIVGIGLFFIRCPICRVYILRRNSATESKMNQFQLRYSILRGICPHCKARLSDGKFPTVKDSSDA